MNAVTLASDHDVDFLAGGGEMGALIRSLDWSQTPLGPMQDWSPALRMMVSFLLANRFPLLLWWGPDYIQIYNDAYRPVLGTKHPQYLGRPVRECWSEIIDVIGPLIDKPFRGGAPTWMEDIELEVNRHGYFEESHFTIAYSPVPDDTAPHGIGGVLATVHEITEKVIGQRRVAILSELGSRSGEAKTAEQACQAAAQTLASHAQDIAYALIYLSEDDGTLRRVCQVRTPGAPAPERVNPDDQDGCGPWPFRSAVVEECAQVTALAEGKAVVLPIKSHMVGRPSGVVIIGANSKIALDAAYVAFLELLTAQIGSAVANASAYEYERRRAEALAELDRAKTIFFSNVSHEFRTPLTLILGPLEEALAGIELPPQARAQLDLVRGNAQRLLKLVNSLLEFSRIEAGRIQASYQPIDLAALTRDLASMFRSTMERAGLQFRVECEDLGVPVYVDPEMWERIVLNLLSNAFKFTLQGEVAVRLHRVGAHAVLDVSDTGVGIAPGEMPRLFERFHRITGAGGRSQEGTGIGLALAHELVRLHGGTIEAASEPGRGTRLRVALPFGNEHLRIAAPPDKVPEVVPGTSTAHSLVHEASRWLPGATEHTAQRLLAHAPPSSAANDRRFASTFGARIVLADDNADMRAYLQSLLAPMYAVETVSDGAEALHSAGRRRPDLILADVMMPNLDGFGLLQQVRSMPALRDVPVILLSARAGGESRIEGLDAGADDYLVKPFTARELLARVGALLERRHASEAIRLRAAQFETLFQATPLGVYVVDADFRIRDINPVARELFGSIPDLIGRDFGDALRLVREPAHALEAERLFRHTLETGEPFSSSERAIRRPDRNGATEYYEWQIHRIPLPDGRHGVLCHFRDISSHVHARLSLELADRQKNEFLAMLAHELRNPMAPIRNVGELLLRNPQQEQRQAITNILRRQIAVLSRLVDDLLDVSRITQGRIELRKRTLQVTEVIAQAVETVQPLLTERRHHLSVVSHGPLRVNGDLTRLVQCVVNLLSNAAKYTQPGGEVRVESQQQGAEVVITVNDNGAGITPELLPYVFDLFVQSARTLDRAQGGLGVGLALVRRLVELHGGRVAAASAGSGHGATFEIRLPLVRADEPEVPETAALRSAPRRILIVDDNADAADSLGMLLELEGHKVELSYDARDALQRVHTLKPDVVLLDIGLPQVDGYEVARTIRGFEEFKGVRLVALTGYGQAEDRQKARAAGFDAHLVKPVDPAAIRRVLARA